MMLVISLTICLLLSAAASIFLKIGALSLEEPLSVTSILTNYAIWAGAFFYIAAFIAYIYVLRYGALSLAQPVITSGASIFTALFAYFIFKEHMIVINWVGLMLICFGVFFLSYGRV